MARPRQFRDQDILTRTMLVFWRHGYEGSNVRRLEKASGLTASSLYNRFGSKEALFLEVLDHYLKTIVDRRICQYLTAGDPLAGLRGFLESTYDYVDPASGRQPLACLLANSALELGHTHPDAAARINQGMQRVGAAFAATLERACAAGQLPAGCDTRQFALTLLMGLQGLLVSSRGGMCRADLQDCTDALLATLPLTATQGARHESAAHP